MSTHEVPSLTMVAQRSQITAANESNIVDASQFERERLGLLEQLCDPPAGLPFLPAALSALSRCLDAVAHSIPMDAALRSRLRDWAKKRFESGSAETSVEAIIASVQQKKHYGLYFALVRLGFDDAPQPHGSAVCPLHELVGAWSLHFAITGQRPKAAAVTRVIAASSMPQSSTSTSWTAKQRARAAGDALHQLRKAIKSDRAAALALGLATPAPQAETSLSQTDDFNRRFRQHFNNLLRFKSADEQAGAGGHGALSRAGVKHAGRELITGVRAGQRQQLHVCLEVLSHVSANLLQRMPVQLGPQPPEGALAWLDVFNGMYCYQQIRVLEAGARPAPGTEHLYESTTPTVQVRLSPPLVAALRCAGKQHQADFCSVAELLGRVGHEPRQAVAGSGPYRVTASKLRTSLPALLLQQGRARWPVALATSSPFVVSSGRPYYGITRQSDIDRVIDDTCDLLGWPRPGGSALDTAMVGSFTTPKLMAVRLALTALTDAADAAAALPESVEDVLDHVNAHAAYLAMLMALGFALRERIVYPLPTPALRVGAIIKVDDKSVHELDMPAIPVTDVIAGPVRAWARLVFGAISSLRRIGSAAALGLADVLQARLDDHDTVGWIFTISAAHTLEAVGTRTWRRRLPLGLELVENFGRHFWPHRLFELGLSQFDVDVLMRHQMPRLHPGSSHMCGHESETQARLAEAMREVLVNQLDLPVPRALMPFSND